MGNRSCAIMLARRGAIVYLMDEHAYFRSEFFGADVASSSVCRKNFLLLIRGACLTSY